MKKKGGGGVTHLPVPRTQYPVPVSVGWVELALSRSANRANPIFGKFLKSRPCSDPAVGVPFLGIVDVAANSAFVFFHSRYPFQKKSGEGWGREPVDDIRVNPAGKPVACRQEFIPETHGKHKNQCLVVSGLCLVTRA